MFGFFTNAVLELWLWQRAEPRVRRPSRSRRRLRQRVYWRDNGICAYCGKLVKYDDSTLDHVQPLVLGGSHSIHNTVLACQPCNREKGPLTMESAPDLSLEALQRRWASLDTVRKGES